MNSIVGKSTGIALLLAAGLLAALFAMGVFSAQGVGATVNSDATFALSNHTAGATDVTIIATFQVSANVVHDGVATFTVAGGDGEFDFPTIADGSAGDALPAELSITQAGSAYPIAQVDVDATLADAETVTIKVTSKASNPAVDGEVQILADVDIVITIRGITNPASAGDYTIGVNDGNTAVVVTLAIIARENMATAENTPGAGSRLEIQGALSSDTVATISDDTIVVGLASFGVPTSIHPDDVDIRAGTGSNAINVKAGDVTVSGTTVTIYVGFDAAGLSVALPSATDTRVIFRKDAGITLPIRHGTYDISIGTVAVDADAVAADDINRVQVNREVSVDSASASRGTEITFSGKGFADGTADVRINGDVFTNAEVDDGEFSAAIDTAAEDNDGDPVFDATNTLNASDSRGNSAAEDAAFDIDPSFSVSPDNPLSGADITITLADAGDPTAVGVSFAGATAVNAAVNGDGNWVVQVPAGTRIGTIQLSIDVDGLDDPLTQNITIGTNDLTISPTTVVPRQEIAIDGGGFTAGGVIAGGFIRENSVTVGTVETTHGEQLVNNNGDVSFNLLVPDGAAAGTREVRVEDAAGRVGVADITVAEPTVTVDPAESLIGSDVVVTGSGFPANDLVLIRYNDSVVETAQTSSTGDFQDTITVPSGTGPGSDNTVEAESQVNDTTLTAEADHSLPDASITLSPASAQAGSTITISGDSFLGFLQVAEIKISGTNVTPVPGPETDVWGAFSEEGIRVPQLSPGRYAVQVTVDGSSPTEFLQVVEATAAAVTDPADVFAPLGDRLERVWYLDRENQKWSFFDPAPRFAGHNTLESVPIGTGESVTIIISAGDPVEFQGLSLYQGTNPIALD